MASRISTDEKRWRAESDARALADAIEIQGDPARLAAAKKAAAERAKEMADVAARHKAVATAKPAPKSPAKPAPRKGK